MEDKKLYIALGALVVGIILISVLLCPHLREQRVFNSLEECNAASVECVYKSEGSTVAYIKKGTISEGERFETILTHEYSDTNFCSSGLNAVRDDSYVMEYDSCLTTSCPCYICTKCGNGECGLGENKCNCPKDCLKL